MEHPLIGNIDDLDIDQLSAKVNDLYSKLAIAQKSGNGHLANQVRMAIETFQNKYQQRLNEQFAKQNKTVNFDDKINIQ
jgi:hypothetical protein